MFSIHFRRFLLLAVMVGLVTAVTALTAQATPPHQEDRPSRTNIEDIPHFPLAETPEAGLALESVMVVPASKVAFQSYRSGNWDIFVGNDNGTGQTAVTNHGQSEIHPHLNRGNTAVVYASRVDGHDYEVYRMNADGNNKVALTNNEADDGNPQWSPDGTRIVFESYRDGQAEIYVMNANGSGQTRLTNNSAFDGMPSWSPDGSKIAFSSYRTGAYRIWVMNADGSNPVRLSSQPYSFRPQWSPDGTKIAYDADGNNDSWQELWWMNADGSNQQAELTATNNTDLWVGSWSPDGRYIAITRIHFVYYQGNWYWDYAYQEGRDINLYNYDPATFPLSQSDVDWYPRWQTSDGQPPVSQVHALGTQSPSPISVSWSGTDTGGSGGISAYDVQVKVGANGSWTDWQMGTTSTSGQYPGIGGTTCYFRARAHDRHHNVENWPASHDTSTTVETLPPQSYVYALPPYSRYDNALEVGWGGHDPGGSGIATYDVQYRINNSQWVNWQNQTSETSAVLETITPGATYQFRTRAIDRAQNSEGWQDQSDTQTTIYRWGITGVAYDNTYTPIGNSVAETLPSPMATLPSDREGHYGSYVVQSSNVYSVTWSKEGYLRLPPTQFPQSRDKRLDIVLPPADNVVAEWGFESGILSPEWVGSGSNLPIITDTLQHTGRYSAWVGDSKPVVVQEIVAAHTMAIDPNNLAHVVWVGFANGSSTDELFYMQRQTDGNWTAPQNISTGIGEYAELTNIMIGMDSKVHVTWTASTDGFSNRLYYRQRNTNGAWASPVLISADIPEHQIRVTSLVLQLGADGSVHLAWLQEQYQSGTYCGEDVYYAERNQGGNWSSPLNLTNFANCGSSSHYPANLSAPDGFANGELNMIVSENDAVHLIWNAGIVSGTNAGFIYVQRNSNGNWLPPEVVVTNPMPNHFTNSVDMETDSSNAVHVVWINWPSQEINYTQRHNNGLWDDPTLLVQPEYVGGVQIELDSLDTIHAVWWDFDNVHYLMKERSSSWVREQQITDKSLYSPVYLLIDSFDNLHLVWLSEIESEETILRSQKNGAGLWATPVVISQVSEDVPFVQPEVDSSGILHAIWADVSHYYYGPNWAQQDTDSILSQGVSIPVTMTNPTLSFMYQLGGSVLGDESVFRVEIDNGTTILLSAKQTRTLDWTHDWYDLSPWAGQSVAIRFKLDQAAGAPTAWALLDEVSVGSAYPDSDIRVNDGNAAPGQEVVQTITYSNRGGALASGVTLTYTLSAGMTYISASIPPASTNPLVWHLPDLPAKSEPFEILVTARVNANTPAFTTLTSTAVISTDDPELELLNNQAEGHIYTAARLYLPAMFR